MSMETLHELGRFLVQVHVVGISCLAIKCNYNCNLSHQFISIIVLIV